MKNLILILTFCFVANYADSQAPVNFKSVDEKSYQYFLAKQWDSLICIGNTALENNIDYFYLRSRMGIAWFEKKNYVNAAPHFERALKFNESDRITIEYLYYSYLYCGRNSDANHLVKKYPQAFEKTVKSYMVREVYLDGGLCINPGNGDSMEKEIAVGAEWQESNVIKNILYGGGGFCLLPHKKILMSIYYSYMNIDNTKQIHISSEHLNDNYKLVQNQVYANATYLISPGFTVTPAFNYIKVDFETLFSGFDTTLNKVVLSRSGIAIDNYAASLAIEKKMAKFGINVFGNYSNLNNGQQIQGGLTLSFIPFGNLNLYSYSTAVLHNESKKNDLILEEKIGGKVFKYLWADAFATVGRLKNYVEQNAFVVHNIDDVINFRYGASLIVPVKRLKISVKYQGIFKSARYNYYQSIAKSGRTDYQNYLFLLSLSWAL